MTDSDEEVSNQLQQELNSAVKNSPAINRPILTHLNADTTWLLSLPLPKEFWSSPTRSRYNILIDPWLQGPQSDVAPWFSTQWHASESSVQSISQLNDILHVTESTELGRDTSNMASSPGNTYIDAVLCSHEFSDHCHEATLREVSADVPVFATTQAAKLIRSWNHFRIVVEIPLFDSDTDWRDTSISPLPPWIGVGRIVTKGDFLSFHAAVIITIAEKSRSNAEAIIYTPHGITANSLQVVPLAIPQVRTLALLHGLHDVSLALSTLNLGFQNALLAQKILGCKYWTGTHDEVKIAKGIISPLLRRTRHTMEFAPGSHSIEDDGHLKDLINPSKTRYIDVQNGHSLVLD